MTAPRRLTIDSWYDRSERVWITTVKDANGNQVGDALVDGNRHDKDASRRFLRSRIKDGTIR